MWIGPALHRRLCRARDLLAADDEPQSLDAIAARVGLSRTHLIRRFESLFGATPHQFRTALRLERARTLLARDQAVTDVCFALGFSSLGSFSALFARRVGVAPSAYRRLVQVPRARSVIPGCFGSLAALPRDAFRTSREASPRGLGHAPTP